MNRTDDPKCTRSTGANQRCCQRLSRHVRVGDDLVCPIDVGKVAPRTFRPHPVTPRRASTSMNGDTAAVLNELVRRALAGEDLRVWARRNAQQLGQLARVAGSVLARVEQQRAMARAGESEAESGVRERVTKVRECRLPDDESVRVAGHVAAVQPNADATAWLEDGHGGELPEGYV